MRLFLGSWLVGGLVWGLVMVERTILCRGLRGGGFRRTFLLYILIQDNGRLYR